MSHAQAHPSYKTYWIAWFVLLLITVAMVFIGSKPVLVLGMAVKAAIIAMLFMHLKFEKRGLIMTVVLGILLTTSMMVVIFIPEGNQM